MTGAPAGAYLRLRHPESTTGIPVASSGSFYWGGLEPGPYTIELRTGNLLRGRKEVDLSAGDADAVMIAADQEPAANFTLPVQFRAEKAGEAYQPSSNAFLVLQKVGTDEARLAQMNADGTFQFTDLTPDLYRLETIWTLDHFYVKSILLGGEAVAGRTLDLRNGSPGGMQIVMARKSAGLTGKLAGETPPGSRAVTILLVNSRGGIEERVHDDQYGQFRMDHIAPGTYRLFALEQFDESTWNSDIAAALAAKSLAVELRDGETKSVTLSLIGSQELEAAVK